MNINVMGFGCRGSGPCRGRFGRGAVQIGAYAMVGVALAAGGWAPLRAELNVPVATRVLSFLQPPMSGATQAAIIYAPDNAASVAEAAALERTIGNGYSAGAVVVRTRRVPVGSLDTLQGYRVAFVTAGLRGSHDQIAAAATRASVVTITSDQACVQAARCVVGIGSGARVQITVSRAAARAVKARFGSAFLMLVKEI